MGIRYVFRYIDGNQARVIIVLDLVKIVDGLRMILFFSIDVPYL